MVEELCFGADKNFEINTMSYKTLCHEIAKLNSLQQLLEPLDIDEFATKKRRKLKQKIPISDLTEMKRNFNMLCSVGSNILYQKRSSQILKRIQKQIRLLVGRISDDDSDCSSVSYRYSRIISEIQVILIRNRIHLNFTSLDELKEFVGSELWPVLRSNDSFKNPFDTKSGKRMNDFINKFIYDVKGLQ